ncbi:hypothetical protein Scep_000160 [Stephania cephalantha]|uniref:SANT domain-containing protein n=1 Tax=Stephania cephalantha TaxID=152367 RepID=A0AAP0L9R3_9MAGN
MKSRHCSFSSWYDYRNFNFMYVLSKDYIFDALQQFGKNFEKITCRVQSKNKDQVRHYYYRLVRRMNKLLRPGFNLDAKNSIDN